MRRFRDTKSIYSVGCIEWKFNSTSIPIWNVYKSKLKAISHNPTPKGIESNKKKDFSFFLRVGVFSLRLLGSLFIPCSVCWFMLLSSDVTLCAMKNAFRKLVKRFPYWSQLMFWRWDCDWDWFWFCLHRNSFFFLFAHSMPDWKWIQYNLKTKINKSMCNDAIPSNCLYVCMRLV